MSLEEFIKNISLRVEKYLEKECLSREDYSKLEKLWLCLEFPEQCFYKDIEWYGYSYELGVYEGFWIHFIINELRDILPEECILRPSLACELSIDGAQLRVRDILYEALVEFFHRRRDVCEKMSKDFLNILDKLSKEAKQIILTLYLDGDIVKNGKLVLCNTTLESIFMPTIRILFRSNVDEKILGNAVKELISSGLLAHCAWRSGVVKFYEYIIPPYLRHYWSEIPKYIDIVIPKVRHIDLSLRNEIIREIQNLERQLDEVKKRLEDIKKLIDKALLLPEK